ncbi:MAG: hypothetical protein ACREU4_08290, partial [Burkholderiales bacterium]
MRGISFETPLPVARVSPARMDVALFVGLLRERPRSSLPDDLERRLRESGLLVAPRAPDAPLLLNTPVPLDAAADLERLFVRERPLRADGEGLLDANLAAAVDAFFAEGGRRCYVLSLGDPQPYLASRGARLEALHRLLFGPIAPAFWAALETGDLGALFLPDLQGPRTFREQLWGIAHLLGLEEATYLCLP